VQFAPARLFFFALAKNREAVSTFSPTLPKATLGYNVRWVATLSGLR